MTLENSVEQRERREKIGMGKQGSEENVVVSLEMWL